MRIYTGNTLSFQHNGFHTVDSSHPKFEEIVKLAFDDDFAGAAGLLDVKKAVNDMVTGTSVTLTGDTLYYKGTPVSGLLGERIVEMSRKGLTVAPLIAFLENLQENPSSRAVEELYGFLESSKLPITDDGHFLAYKSVRQDYMDHHSGSIDNSVGQVITMPRNKVNEDKDQTCSYGLHFAAHEYAVDFGSSGRMMVMKINPRDVVSIPSDYNNQKGRCCKYEVVEEVEREDRKLVGAVVVNTAPKAAPVTTGPKVGNVYTIRYESWVIYDINPQEHPDWPYRVQSLSSQRKDGWSAYTLRGAIFEGTQPLEDTYEPQVDNYGDIDVWDDGLEREFIGDTKEFPVNRQSTYTLYRHSTGKAYGNYYFTAYKEDTGSLVFRKHNGVDFNYCTVCDLGDWEITLENAVIGS